MAGYVMTGWVRKHVEFGGIYRIRGRVDRLGVYGAYPAVLFSHVTNAPIDRGWSDADGWYIFNWLAYVPQGYYVVAFDPSNPPENAGIATLITPEPMP